MPRPRPPRLLFLLSSAALLLVPPAHAQESNQDSADATRNLVQVACNSDAPSEFRSFKQRQIRRRQADLEKTVASLRADALANADIYTAEDRRDLSATLERLRTEQEEIRAFLANGCATTAFATPASVKQLSAASSLPAVPGERTSTPFATTTNTTVSVSPSATSSPVPESPLPSSTAVVDSASAKPAATSAVRASSGPQEPTPTPSIPPNRPDLSPMPTVDVQAMKKQVDDIQNALSSQSSDFGLVLGVGSLVINPNASDYTNDSNVLHTTNLGSATPQLLTGVTFRSHLPPITRRWRDTKTDDGKNFVNGPRCSGPITPSSVCREPWQYHPWSGFVSLKFAPGASQFINGYVIGGTYSITKHLDALVGFALTPVNEASPGFRVTAAQFVANQQKLGFDMNFDPNAMLANKRNAFDGFPVTDSTGRLIYQGSPTTVHYRAGVVIGVSFPIYFGAALKPSAESK